MSEHDVEFPAMGSDFRLLIGPPVAGGPTAARAADLLREFLARFEARLSRFRPGSELSELNAAPSADVAASPLLRAAVRAGLWAAERTGGLVDPTLLGALEAAGYGRSRRGPELSLAIALAHAPARRPAAPDPAARWRAFAVDDARGVIRRPPGLRFDTGGTGKGLAADLAAVRLADHERWAIDCGGDLRVGGPYGAPAAEPFTVDIEHPLTGERAHSLRLRTGAVATSGLDIRLWRRPDGTPAHHLLDPFNGDPAWTGLVGATALAPTALEAEVLAKAALLSGPAGARRWLGRHGGLVVRDDGDVEPCGPLRSRPVVRLRRAGDARVKAA
jgi:thiamine biosynthesis lipoprotein